MNCCKNCLKREFGFCERQLWDMAFCIHVQIEVNKLRMKGDYK